MFRFTQILGITAALVLSTQAFAQKAASKKAAKSKPATTLSAKTAAKAVSASATEINGLPAINNLTYIRKGTGKKADIGMKVTLNMVELSYKDSILSETAKRGGPMSITMSPSPWKGSIEAVVSALREGDSVHFQVPADSIFKKYGENRRPPFCPKGSVFKYRMGITKVTDPAEMMKANELKMKEYMEKSGHSFTKQASGLHIAITQKGTGRMAVAGDSLRVHYRGTLLDGSKFDASYDRNQPFEFVVGRRMVIQGWDEGFTQIPEGSKAILVIPSNMAYGERSPSPAIPANSPLVFEVELLQIKGNANTPKK